MIVEIEVASASDLVVLNWKADLGQAVTAWLGRNAGAIQGIDEFMVNRYSAVFRVASYVVAIEDVVSAVLDVLADPDLQHLVRYWTDQPEAEVKVITRLTA